MLLWCQLKFATYDRSTFQWNNNRSKPWLKYWELANLKCYDNPQGLTIPKNLATISLLVRDVDWPDHKGQRAIRCTEAPAFRRVQERVPPFGVLYAALPCFYTRGCFQGGLTWPCGEKIYSCHHNKHQFQTSFWRNSNPIIFKFLISCNENKLKNEAQVNRYTMKLNHKTSIAEIYIVVFHEMIYQEKSC